MDSGPGAMRGDQSRKMRVSDAGGGASDEGRILVSAQSEGTSAYCAGCRGVGGSIVTVIWCEAGSAADSARSFSSLSVYGRSSLRKVSRSSDEGEDGLGEGGTQLRFDAVELVGEDRVLALERAGHALGGFSTCVGRGGCVQPGGRSPARIVSRVVGERQTHHDARQRAGSDDHRRDALERGHDSAEEAGHGGCAREREDSTRRREWAECGRDWTG